MKIVDYTRCQCGAISIEFENGVVNHMKNSTFRQLKLKLPYKRGIRKTYCCDHCVNHYGIDLCSCGSGKRVGKCDCGSNEPMENLGIEHDTFSKIIQNLGMI